MVKDRLSAVLAGVPGGYAHQVMVEERAAIHQWRWGWGCVVAVCNFHFYDCFRVKWTTFGFIVFNLACKFTRIATGRRSIATAAFQLHVVQPKCTGIGIAAAMIVQIKTDDFKPVGVAAGEVTGVAGEGN